MRHKILHVDDSEEKLCIRGRMLRNAGFDVIEATSGDEALRLAREERPSLVLLDVRLSGTNGFAVCKRLKSDPETRSIPVLHISSIRKAEHGYPEAADCGSDGFLLDSPEPDALVTTVSALIRAHEAEQKAEQAIRSSHAVFETMAETYVELDAEYRYVYANAAAEQTLRRRREDILGKDVWALAPYLAGTVVEAQMRQVMLGRQPRIFENFHEPKAEWWEVRIFPVEGGGISILGCDITARKMAEAELRKSVEVLETKSALLKLAQLAAQFGVFDWNIKTNQNQWSPEIFRLFRLDPATTEPSFDTWLETVHPDDRRRAVAEAHKVLASPDGIFNFEYPFVDGLRWIWGVGQVFRDADGRPHHMIGINIDVTERHLTAETLREKERNWLTLFDAMPAGIVVVEPDSQRLLAFNDAACASLGYSRREFEPLTIADIRAVATPEEGMQRQNWISAIPIRFETQHRCKTGELRDVLVTASRVKFDGRNCSLRIFTDITARKRAERELQESETRLRLAHKAAHAGAWDRNLETGQTIWTEEFRQLYGLDDAEATDERWLESVHPDDRDRCRAALRELLSQDVEQIEFRIVRPDGSIRWLIGFAQVLRNPEGAPVRLVGISMDITDRKTAEIALRENQLRFETMAEMMPEFLFTGLPDGANDYVSSSFYQYSGREPESALGSGWSESLHPDDYERALERWSESLRTGKEQNLECRLRRHDGQYRWFHTRAVPIRDAGGRIVKWFGVCSDIDDLKAMEARLKESNLELEQFASIVSHDLQAPLLSIETFSKWLSERYEGKLDPQADQYLTFIRTSVRKMKRFTRDLLDYSRIASEPSRPLAIVDLQQTLARALLQLREQTIANNAAITFDPLPKVLAQNLPVERIFLNLIGNALKHRGAETPEIHISAKADGGRWIVSVRDNGVGFAMAESQRVFKPFERLRPAETDGTGLGLSICKRIVEKLNGRIWAESEPGKGTVIFFTLPSA